MGEPTRSAVAAVLVFAAAFAAGGAPAQPQPGFRQSGSFGEQSIELRLPSGPRAIVIAPERFIRSKPALLVIYATPNGATIEQTLGRRARSRDEWRYDIQHVAAQVRRYREIDSERTIAVACLEAPGLSWPAWRAAGSGRATEIGAVVDAVRRSLGGIQTTVVLAGHSGGGSFLLGFIEAHERIPPWVERVVFLDANYSYSDDRPHAPRLLAWLDGAPGRRLVVLAYDDRSVTLNGKPVVSAIGGTYRATQRMVARIGSERRLTPALRGDFDTWRDAAGQMMFGVHRNYANRILHTALVGDMNGLLFGLALGGIGERAWGQLGGPRAYSRWIEPVEPAPMLRIPARLAGSPRGSEFAAKIAGATPAEREQLVVEEALAGNVPDMLRCLRRVSYDAKDAGGAVHKVVAWVAPDYLAIGTDDDFVRMPMTPASAARISAAFGCALPTRLLVDAIDRAAEVRLDPRPMTAAREAVTTFVVHNAIIEEQRTGAPLGPIVSGAKKDLVLTKLLEARPDRVAIYGWRRGDGRPIQPLSTVHAASYVDYSHGVRLVWRTVLVDGKEMDYYRILADPVLSALVSDEGQFRPRL